MELDWVIASEERQATRPVVQVKLWAGVAYYSLAQTHDCIDTLLEIIHNRSKSMRIMHINGLEITLYIS